MGGRPPRSRPVGWGQQFVLEWMKANPTADVREVLCEMVGPQCGDGGLSAGVVYGDILKWRKENEAFREEYEALMLTRRDPFPANSKDAQDPDWREKWGEAYIRERSLQKASRAVGSDWKALALKIKPGHPSYDQPFHEIVEACREALKGHFEDVLNWAVDEAQVQLDPKTAGGLAVTILERIDKSRWSRSEERVNTGRVEHHHTHVVELSLEAQNAMRHAELTSARIRGHLAPPPQAVDVVDVVAEKVER
jgi:hypothetical protein